MLSLAAAASFFIAASAHSVASGPATGSATRFAVTSPLAIAASGRAKAAPKTRTGASLPELEIPDLPDRADALRPSAPPA